MNGLNHLFVGHIESLMTDATIITGMARMNLVLRRQFGVTGNALPFRFNLLPVGTQIRAAGQPDYQNHTYTNRHKIHGLTPGVYPLNSMGIIVLAIKYSMEI